MKKLQAKPGYSSQEIDILGVTSCVEVAVKCVDMDRSKRPCIQQIVHELEELEAKLKTMSLAPDVSKTVQVRFTTGKTWEPLLCFARSLQLFLNLLQSSVLHGPCNFSLIFCNHLFVKIMLNLYLLNDVFSNWPH